MAHGSRVRFGLALASVVTGSVWSGFANAQQPTPAKQYLIRCKLVEAGEKGQPQVLAEPTLVTTIGQPAVIEVGDKIIPAAAAGKAPPAFNGMTLTTTLIRIKEGQLVLDATLNVSTALEASDTRTRVAGQSIRTVEPVVLKQTIAVPAGERDDQRLEITIEETEGKRVTKPAEQPAPIAQASTPATVPPAAIPPAPLEPTPLAAAQASSQSQSSNGNGGGNPLRGPLGGIRARMRGK